ncbi:MAG TPA: glycoside hydrolase family 99-like domain-containing protein [Candidatus Competibacter sp.]|nr:glycoside hydrolase family 99-like domain-containing protein [Candidatus Competibacteraceae bacterium]HRW64219.1 glycoside hydrolase family 99-like domain-containing protein [Candidatus Competibacter sp.]
MLSRIWILAGKSARFLYRRLPLPLPIRWRIKSFLYRHLGLLLKNSPNYRQWLIQTGAIRPNSAKTPGSATAQSPPTLEIGPENLATPKNPSDPAADPVHLIAFYLPQYHPIPENDRWWGKGFTEWTNVTKATPNFIGHYQPRLPADLGFYDLRVPEVRDEQATLARQYGIHGFCYYYYWFAGQRLLNRPLDEVVRSGHPDFPFCVCWANENWSRRWDGLHADILIAQQHSDEDDLNFIQSLEPALRDPRYIRVNDRPLLLVYRIGLLPDAGRTAAIWRRHSREAGLGELYLSAVQSFGTTEDPRDFGFDAAVEFPPHAMAVLAERPVRMLNLAFQGMFYDYAATAEVFMNRLPAPYPLFRTAMPSWDNTARRQDASEIFLNATPEYYERWLRRLVELTHRSRAGSERLVFINAWNEWAEGNYLEPDRKFGHRYLEATRNAIKR